MFSTYAKIQILIQQGRFDEAERVIREALALSMDDATLHSLLASVLFRRDRPKESETSARVAIGIDPENTLGRFFLAQALYGQERYREALAAIDEALAIDPEDVDFFGLKSQILLSSGKLEPALESAETGLGLDPDDETCRFFRTVLLARLDRQDEADAESFALLADNPEASSNFSARGWVLAEANDGEGAQRHFMEALRIDPENFDAREGLAYALTLKNPVMGLFLRGINAIGRVPIWVALLAGFGLWKVSDWLMKADLPQPCGAIGLIAKVAVGIFFYCSLIAPLLFQLSLRFTRVGKQLLTRDQRLTLRWVTVPLVIGLGYFLLWVIGGAKNLPLAAVVWFSVARLLHETFLDRNPWLRRVMGSLAALGFVCACWIEYARYGIILSQMMEVMSDLKAAATGGGGEANGPESETRKVALEGMMNTLKEVVRMQARLVTYPSLVLYFIAAFSDDLRSWLKRRAPDA